MTPPEVPSPSSAAPGETLDIQRFRRLYLGPLVTLLLVFKVGVALVWLGMTLPIQWDLTFPEAAVVVRAEEVARGETPYHDWVEWPHGFAPYGPLTYYTTGLAARLAGGDDLFTTTRLIGRIQSQLALAGLLALSVLLLRRMGLSWAWSAYGIAAALAWEPLFGYVVSFRPDAPQVFFALLALYVASGGGGESRPRSLLALAALYVSLWFKATSWGMLAAMSFWLWRGCGGTRAATRLALFVLAGLIPVLLLNRMWEGRLWMNLVGSLDNGIDLENFALITSKLTLGAWFILLFGGSVAALQWMRAPMESPRFLLALGTLCSLAATLVTTLKVGADSNYYLEPFVLCGAWTVYGIRELWVLPEEATAGGDVRLISVRREIPLTILLLPFLLFISGRSLISARTDLEKARSLWKEPAVLARAKTIEGPVLSVFPRIAATAGSEAGILDHFQYRVLADRGLLKRTELLSRLRSQYFEAVILEGSAAGPAEAYFLPEFPSALMENYEATEYYGQTTVLFTRRNRPEGASPEGGG